MHHPGAATSLGRLFQGWGDAAGMGSSPGGNALRLPPVPRSGRAPGRPTWPRPSGRGGLASPPTGALDEAVRRRAATLHTPEPGRVIRWRFQAASRRSISSPCKQSAGRSIERLSVRLSVTSFPWVAGELRAFPRDWLPGAVGEEFVSARLGGGEVQAAVDDDRAGDDASRKGGVPKR